MAESSTLTRAAARVARAFGRPHAVLTATGSAAIELAIEPLVRGPNSEVVVPDEACHRVAASVMRAGARPVFVAVDRTLVLAPDAVAEALTSRTVAVVAVHQYGLPAPVAQLRAALPHDVALIEDVAQAWRVRSAGWPVGSSGSLAITSFGATKPVRVGAGGAIVGCSPDVGQRVSGSNGERFLASPPMPAPFPGPLADRLLDAIERADELVGGRRRVVDDVTSLLEARGLHVRALAPGDAAAWQRLPVWAPDERWRDRLADACRRAGIPVQRPHAVATDRLPMFAAARRVGDPARAARERLALLPTEVADGSDRYAAALRSL